VTVHIALKNRLNEQKLGTPDFETDISGILISGNTSYTDASAEFAAADHSAIDG